MHPIHGFSADLNSSLVIFSATFPILYISQEKELPKHWTALFRVFLSQVVLWRKSQPASGIVTAATASIGTKSQAISLREAPTR